jgi:hypothetical protein
MSKGEKWTIGIGLLALVGVGLQVWIAVVHEQEHTVGIVNTLFAILFWVSLGAVNVYSIYRNLRDARRVKDTTKKAATMLIEYQDSGSQSVLLYYFAENATQLACKLEDAWHHWNQEGECLSKPLGGPPGIKNISSDKFVDLSNERRDFMVLYMDNISRFKVEFPKLITSIVEYPSDAEYQVVLTRLKEHADLLRNTADKIFNSGKGMEL